MLRGHCVRDRQLRQHPRQRPARGQQLESDTRVRQIHHRLVHHFAGGHQNCRRRFRLVLQSNHLICISSSYSIYSTQRAS